MFHRPILTNRFFFVLRPPITLARQITAAAHWLHAGDAVAADRVHITVFIVDDQTRYPEQLVVALTAIGDGLAAAPITVTLDRVAGSQRSIALRPQHANPGLRDLHRQLATLAASAGVAERSRYTFSPHLTLGYRDGAPFNDAVAPISWRADDIVLIHSRVGQTRHDVLGRWPLRESPETQLALF